MSLKEYRICCGLSIHAAALITGIPVRTYIRYENNEDYGDKTKREAIYSKLKAKCEITEEKGILSIESIKQKVDCILDKHSDTVAFCYLFGSYAKGYATETSDVDLCISTTLTGLDFVGLIEEIRITLCKKVDLLRIHDMKDNVELINEIMKDGIKIYG